MWNNAHPAPNARESTSTSTSENECMQWRALVHKCLFSAIKNRLRWRRPLCDRLVAFRKRFFVALFFCVSVALGYSPFSHLHSPSPLQQVSASISSTCSALQAHWSLPQLIYFHYEIRLQLGILQQKSLFVNTFWWTMPDLNR